MCAGVRILTSNEYYYTLGMIDVVTQQDTVSKTHSNFTTNFRTYDFSYGKPASRLGPPGGCHVVGGERLEKA